MDVAVTTPQEVRFAIVVATYCRSNGKTLPYLERCLNSVLSQTHTHWDLFLISDKYEPEEELLAFLKDVGKNMTKNGLFYLNNLVVERDVIKDDPNQLWCCAGANSMNIGLALARRKGYKYYAHLDDDDYWTPDHLEEIAKIYAAYPRCVFVCTKAAVDDAKKTLPITVPDTPEVFENNILPTPCSMVHSAFSFRMDVVPFYYRTNLNPVFHVLSGEAPIQAADGNMLHNIRLFVQNSDGVHTAIYVPKLTCYHDIEREELIKGSLEKPEESGSFIPTPPTPPAQQSSN